MTQPIHSRIQSAEAVLSAIRAYGPRIDESFQMGFGRFAEGEGEPRLGQLFACLERALEDGAEALRRAEVSHQEEMKDDAPALQARSNAQVELHRGVVELRVYLEGHYGSAAPAMFGFEGSTPRDPDALDAFAGQLIEALPATEPPAPVIAGTVWDSGPLIAKLEGLRAALSLARSDVAREERELVATSADKSEALAEYDQRFRLTSGLLALALELIGEDQAARRLRPSSQHPGLTAELGGL